MDNVSINMEENRILDVPITQYRDHLDHTRLLSPDVSNSDRYSEESNSQVTRFKSLRSSVRPVFERTYEPESHEPQPYVQHIPSIYDARPPPTVDFEQSTNYVRQPSYTQLEYPPELWKPFWIRPSTLSVLLLFDLVIIVGLILLWHFSGILDGFALNSSISQYVWRCIPLAIMVVIISLWRQVDHYFKLLAPWDELRKGPVRASHSILLDYVSPMHLLSFFTAFKRGYIPILLSISVFVLLKVITIFSAALLVPLPTIINSNSTSARWTRSFDASSFKPLSYPNVATFSPNPVYSTLGNVLYGLPFGAGVQDGFAYLPVDLWSNTTELSSDAVYVAPTRVFIPNLQCTSVSAIIPTPTVVGNATTANNTNNYIEFTLKASSVCQKWRPMRVAARNPYKEVMEKRGSSYFYQVAGSMQPVYCASDQQAGNPLSQSAILESEPAGLLFTSSEIGYNQTLLPNGTILNSTRITYETWWKNVLCVPGYNILDANISYSANGIDIPWSSLQSSSLPNSNLSDLSGKNLGVLFQGIMNASEGIFGKRQNYTWASPVPNTVFGLMALIDNRTESDLLNNADRLSSAATKTFRLVMSHFVAESFTKQAANNVTAQLVYTRNKLHVCTVPFYILLVGFALCALGTGALCLLTPGPLVAKDPSLIASLAAILARSPELNRILRSRTSTKPYDNHAMDAHEFGTAIATNELGQSSFKLVVSERRFYRNLPTKSQKQSRAFLDFLLLPAFGLAVLMPLTLIGVLEFLQRRSDSDHGLATITNTKLTPLSIVSIPVLVMLLVGAVVQFLDFHVKLFSPWNKLAKGNANPEKTVLSHLVGKLPPVAFVDAVRGAHTGAIFSILAAALASVFAVLGSALYNVDNVTAIDILRQVTATDAFQLSGIRYNVTNDKGAAGILRLIDLNGVSYPTGTFDNLVFSNYAATQQQQNPWTLSNTTLSPYTATLPAIRATLKCEFVKDGNIKYKYLETKPGYPYYQINSSYDLPSNCKLGGPGRNSPNAYFQNSFNFTDNSTTLFAGELLDLTFGPGSNITGNFGEAKPNVTGNNIPVGCPSLALTFARMQGNYQIFSVTSLYCYQQVQQLKVNVTYKTNSTDLDPKHPPNTDESSVSLVKNPDNVVVDTFDWRVQLNLERQLYGLGSTRFSSPEGSNREYHFDAFFSYLMDNMNINPDTLAGISNHQALIDNTTTLYSRYMAQAISGNMRTSIVTNSNSAHKRQQSLQTNTVVTMNATIADSRLIQDRDVKSALQIVLGLSVLCSILTYLFTTFYPRIPSNPCSIASTMSLLAGSDLCWSPEDVLCDCCGKERRSSLTHEPSSDGSAEGTIVADPGEYQTAPGSYTHSASTSREQIIPDGAEWLDHRDFASVFAGRTYSLGWWKEDRAKGRRRRYGVDAGGRPDGEEDEDWELGGRRNSTGGVQGFDGFMMKGREMLSDQRGRYQRTDGGDFAGAGRGEILPQPMPRPGLARYDRESSPPPQGIMSPRRVRFEEGY